MSPYMYQHVPYVEPFQWSSFVAYTNQLHSTLTSLPGLNLPASTLSPISETRQKVSEQPQPFGLERLFKLN